jgi:hypothetical protein
MEAQPAAGPFESLRCPSLAYSEWCACMREYVDDGRSRDCQSDTWSFGDVKNPRRDSGRPTSFAGQPSTFELFMDI